MAKPPIPVVGDQAPVEARSPATVYGLAIAALGAAVLLRYLLDPWLGDALPLVTLFGAVAAAAWLGGVVPASLVTIAGYAACSYFFVQPRLRFDLTIGGSLIGLFAYLFTCALIVGFGEAMRRAQPARRRARRAAAGHAAQHRRCGHHHRHRRPRHVPERRGRSR